MMDTSKMSASASDQPSLTTGLETWNDPLTSNFRFAGVIDSHVYAMVRFDAVDRYVLDSCFAEDSSIGDKLRGMALIFDRLEQHWRERGH